MLPSLSAQVGVSLAFLVDFSQRVPQDWTSAQVMSTLIKPATAPLRRRYADVPSLVPPEHLGRPNLFISHCWKNSFSLLVAAVQGQAAGAVEKDTYVWLDLFAMNQHASEESGADLGDLRGNLEKAVSAWGRVVSHDARVCVSSQIIS
jgi:hypothetical protein